MIPALRRGLVACLVVGLLAAGCSAGGDDSADGGASTAPGASASAGDGHEGGTLRLGLGKAIVVDPVAASPADPTDEMLLDLLHDGLTREDAGGRLRPAVAARWTPDATFRSWTFSLDPQARFTSGKGITATDVVASLEHVLAAGDTSLAALRLESIDGFRAFLDGTAPTVAGLRALDPTTVQIALAAPLATLPEVLAAPAYGIVDVPSLTAAEGGDLTALDLSGSWSVASAEPGRLVLHRRPGAAGHLDGIEVRAYRDVAEAYAQLRDGAVDWAPVPTDEVGAARKADGDDHLTPFQGELALGLRVPRLPDVRLRQAIAAAIDRDAIVAAVYADLADPLTSVVPAGVEGHDPDRCAACVHDPALARSLLAQAFPDGQVPTVTIDFDSSPAQQALAKLVAANLLTVGIPTSLHPLALGDYQRLLVTGGQQLFTLSWIGGDRTPDAYLAPLFQSSSPDNLVGLQSPDVDAALAQARTSGDPAIRAGAWAQAEQQVLAAAIIVPLAQFRTQVAVGKGVTGLVHAVDGSVDWSAVRVG